MNVFRSKQNPLLKEFVFFKTTFVLSNLVMWSFYQILLFKVTNDLSIIILEYLFFYISIWVFFIVGTLVLDKAGYLFAMRFMYSMSMIPIVAMLLLIDQIDQNFILLAVLRAIPHGLYWAVHHTFYIKELHKYNRGSFINVQKSLELVLSIVVPITIGSLITLDQTYTSLYLLGFFLHLISFLIPWKYNKYSNKNLNLFKLFKLCKSKSFIFQGVIFLFDSGIQSLFVAIFAIVPFLLIGNEFGVGSFISLIGIISALVSYLENNKAFKLRYRLGLLGYFIRSIFNVVFAVLWNLPILFIRNAIVVFSSSTSDTILEEIQTNAKENILHNYKNEAIEELNIALETIQLIGRIAALGTVYYLVKIYDPVTIFRVIIIVFSFYKLITLMGMNQALKLKSDFTRER